MSSPADIAVDGDTARARVRSMYVLGTAFASLGALLLFVASPTAGASLPHRLGHKVTLCHATASNTNPYVKITVDVASVKFQGHAGHDGPVWSDDLADHVKWGDIIPAFDYGAGQTYAGKNLPAGHLILDNDCCIPHGTTTTLQGTTTTEQGTTTTEQGTTTTEQATTTTEQATTTTEQATTTTLEPTTTTEQATTTTEQATTTTEQGTTTTLAATTTTEPATSTTVDAGGGSSTTEATTTTVAAGPSTTGGTPPTLIEDAFGTAPSTTTGGQTPLPKTGTESKPLAAASAALLLAGAWLLIAAARRQGRFA